MSRVRRTYTFELAERDPEFVTIEEHGLDPFTHDPLNIQSEVHRPWSPERTAAVNELLESHGARADDNGYSMLTLADGTEIHICFGYEGGEGEGSEVDVVCETVSEAAARFLIEVLGAANMVLVANHGERVPVAVIGPPRDPESAKRWPDAFVVQTPGDLVRWLDRLG
jgi:hypothetical protein